MTTVPAQAQAVSLGEVAPPEPGPALQHGTLSMYQIGRCRCPECRAVKSKQRNQGRVRTMLTGDQARYCQVCWTLIADHPFKACWRELR